MTGGRARSGANRAGVFPRVRDSEGLVGGPGPVCPRVAVGLCVLDPVARTRLTFSFPLVLHISS